MSGCGCRVEGPPSAEVQRQAALGHAGLAHQAALYQQALAAQPRIVYCALHGAAERLAAALERALHDHEFSHLQYAARCECDLGNDLRALLRELGR